MKLIFRLPKEKKGGAGSGHFGHAGRPGKQGGSAPGSGVGSGGGDAGGGSKIASAVKKTGADSYFDSSRTGESSHSNYESWETDMWSSEGRKAKAGPDAKQMMTVHQDKKSGEFWVRIMGGYSGSLNTWSTSKRHSTAEAAIEDAISNSRIPLRTGDILPLAPGIPMD